MICALPAMSPSAQEPLSNPELLTAYAEQDTERRATLLRIAIFIGLVFTPLGSSLDFFVYPGHVSEFLGVRLITDTALLLLLGLLILSHRHGNRTGVRVAGILTPLVINSAFCYMIYRTEGAASPYYAGINLIILGISVLLPWTPRETAGVCAGSFALYLLACFLHPEATTRFAWGPFFNNSFFIFVTGVICVVSSRFLSAARLRDFHQRHQLEIQNDQLEDQNDQLQALDRLKTRFFSNVSHELRTPLTLILSPLEEVLSRPDSLPAASHDHLLLVQRNALRLLKLINELLDLTRLDQGVDILHRRPLDLASFAPGVLDSTRYLGLRKNLRFHRQGDAVPLIVEADPNRLEKILLNLLSNAIKFTPADGAITLRWFRQDGDAVVEISDTGSGIAEADLPFIFDRFRQAGTEDDSTRQGVGIGLALARELAEEHDGRLEAESTPGAGSTFRLVLPIAPESASVETVTSPDSDEQASEPYLHAFRSADRVLVDIDSTPGDAPVVGQGEVTVLVVDDEPDMRRFLVSSLSEDFRVIPAATGEEGLRRARDEPPAVALLDWMLPGISGIEVARQLREDPRYADIKIILLTARADDESKLEALRNGADDFLAKPFSSVEVQQRIRNLAHTADLQAGLRQTNTELRETLTRLQETEAQLVQSEKMNALGMLSAGLLHEINNPLNYALTAISFARPALPEDNEDLREMFDDIDDGMKRIRDIVSDLRTFAYPEEQSSEEPFALCRAFESARQLCASELDGIETTVDLPDDLTVNGRYTQITHLFINLLTNASKACRSATGGNNGFVPCIAVRASESGDRVHVEVSDNGIGMDDQTRERIFEPFFTKRDVGEGMGLGLSTCHTIARSHGSDIEVASRPGEGARFSFHLPSGESTEAAS